MAEVVYWRCDFLRRFFYMEPPLALHKNLERITPSRLSLHTSLVIRICTAVSVSFFLCSVIYYVIKTYLDILFKRILCLLCPGLNEDSNLRIKGLYSTSLLDSYVYGAADTSTSLSEPPSERYPHRAKQQQFGPLLHREMYKCCPVSFKSRPERAKCRRKASS